MDPQEVEMATKKAAKKAPAKKAAKKAPAKKAAKKGGRKAAAESTPIEAGSTNLLNG